jgi:hypothetical protein
MYEAEFNAALAALVTYKNTRVALAAVNEDLSSVSALEGVTVLDDCLAARDAFVAAAAVLEAGVIGNRSLRDGES